MDHILLKLCLQKKRFYNILVENRKEARLETENQFIKAIKNHLFGSIAGSYCKSQVNDTLY